MLLLALPLSAACMLAALPAETRATSAFLDEITAAHSVVLGAIDWHSYSQLILRPYGTSAYAARCLPTHRNTSDSWRRAYHEIVLLLLLLLLLLLVCVYM